MKIGFEDLVCMICILLKTRCRVNPILYWFGGQILNLNSFKVPLTNAYRDLLTFVSSHKSRFTKKKHPNLHFGMSAVLQPVAVRQSTRNIITGHICCQ